MYTLTLAGHETTATTFSFLLYEAARHPEYQARMRQEVLEARARVFERGDVEFTQEDLDAMPVCLNARLLIIFQCLMDRMFQRSPINRSLAISCFLGTKPNSYACRGLDKQTF